MWSNELRHCVRDFLLKIKLFLRQHGNNISVFMLLPLTMDILPDMSLAVVTDQVELDKSICQTQMQK